MRNTENKTIKKKCYIYTRVSTARQVDGFSLDAQVERLEDYAAYRDLEIAGRYCDAGYSGKSIDGRPDFKRMFRDIKSEKDGISFVLVFKLSRFGRNAADVLSSMQILTDYGIDLVSVDDAIDSSTSGGKFTLTILSAVAEIEKENIKIQFTAGKRQSIRNGNWGGGPILYGYKKDGKLNVPKEEEAEVVKKIFDLYVNYDYTMFQIVKYLNESKHTLITRNGERPFTNDVVSRILTREYYCGRIIYGRRSREYKNTGNEDCLIITKGVHQPLVSEEIFDAAQKKVKIERERRKRRPDNEEEISILSGLVKCPICGQGLIARMSRKKNKNHGGFYKTDRAYLCRNHSVSNGSTCSYAGQIRQSVIDTAVFEAIGQIDVQGKLGKEIEGRLGKEADLEKVKKSVQKIEKKRNGILLRIEKLGESMDSLDILSPDYDSEYQRLSDQIDGLYDEMEATDKEYREASGQLSKIQSKVNDADSIRDLIKNFSLITEKMTNEEKREYCRKFIDRIEIFEKRQEDGRILKSITLRFPIEEDNEEKFFIDCADNDLTQAEAKTRGTYAQIKKYAKDKYGVNIHSLYIGQIKTKYGLDKRKNYYISKKEERHIPKCPMEKEKIIVEALKYYKMLGADVEIKEES